MCVAFLAINSVPGHRLVIAANRDEYATRPSRAAHRWSEQPDIVAGIDEEHGGTWFGVSERGRLALVTNVRRMGANDPKKRSRGALVANFLRGDMSAETYAADLERDAYRSFNLVVGDARDLHFVSSARKAERIPDGIHGVSNGDLNEPWPKVVRGKRVVEGLARQPEDVEAALFSLLAERDPFPDDALPRTGVGLPLERALSPVFVDVPDVNYGTRSSTVFLLGDAGTASFVERTTGGAEARFELEIPSL